MKRAQIKVLFILVIIDALSAFLAYTFFIDQMAPSAGLTVPDMGVSRSVLGLANAGIVLVSSGLLGLAGYWFARKLGLPGIYRQDGDWGRWFVIPLVLGLTCGIIFMIGDIVLAPFNGFGLMVHPGFPASILASLSAGIGEEITFRVFVFGLWGFILSWLFKRFHNRNAVMWAANLIAALAFAAGHLGTVLVLTGASSLSEINPVLIMEVFLLNGVLGIVAGQRYMKDGLVAAAGVHFWNDVVFHVLWGLLG